jgi:hypothetical protein
MFIDNILARIEVAHSKKAEVIRVQKNINQQGFSGVTPIHKTYRDYFNLIDLLDKRWYSVQEHHGNYSWKSKMLFAIMRFFTINVWTLSLSEQYCSYKIFRKNLARSLIERK